jgi:hypothetical protein
MLTPKPHDADERRLTQLYRALDPADRRTLLAFAEFLGQAARAGANPHSPADAGLELEPEPEPVPRPETETVIGAIRRLSRSYAMLDRGLLLHETSALMSAHVLQGREAVQVIDDLEALFARHYRDYRTRVARPPAAAATQGE